MTPHLLIHRHGRHQITGDGVEGEDVKDAAAVDEEPVLDQHQDLGWVQRGCTQRAEVSWVK